MTIILIRFILYRLFDLSLYCQTKVVSISVTQRYVTTDKYYQILDIR